MSEDLTVEDLPRFLNYTTGIIEECMRVINRDQKVIQLAQDLVDYLEVMGAQTTLPLQYVFLRDALRDCLDEDK